MAKEVGLVDLNIKTNTKAKKRSLTITSSNPASVIEALNNHQAKVIFIYLCTLGSFTPLRICSAIYLQVLWAK